MHKKKVFKFALLKEHTVYVLILMNMLNIFMKWRYVCMRALINEWINSLIDG